MNPDGKVKTTVRLPADLHWRFQAERAKRRLSNETAIRAAFSSWIAGAPLRAPGGVPTGRRIARGTAKGIRLVSESERQLVDQLLQVLRNSENPAPALAVTAVIGAMCHLCAETAERLGGKTK
jgi:hypothetical protein